MHTGLDVQWWASTNIGPTATQSRPALATLGIGDATGAVNQDWGTGGPTGLKDGAGNALTDGFSASLTGVVVFPAVGSYGLHLDADDTASLHRHLRIHPCAVTRSR